MRASPGRRKYASGLLGSRATMKTPALTAVACAFWFTHCSHAPVQAEAPAPAQRAPPPPPPPPPPTPPPRLSYPAARLDDLVDDYHGPRVADPYRWLENP